MVLKEGTYDQSSKLWPMQHPYDHMIKIQVLCNLLALTCAGALHSLPAYLPHLSFWPLVFHSRCHPSWHPLSFCSCYWWSMPLHKAVAGCTRLSFPGPTSCISSRDQGKMASCSQQLPHKVIGQEPFISSRSKTMVTGSRAQDIRDLRVHVDKGWTGWGFMGQFQLYAALMGQVGDDFHLVRQSVGWQKGQRW